MTAVDGSITGDRAMTPEQIVAEFYDWYFSYMGDPACGEMRNPVADGAYRDSKHLSPQLVERVDGIVASFDRGGYDPFLCAQDRPQHITVEPAYISGQHASVVVDTSFEGHLFTVELESVDGQWRISNIVCGIPEPLAPQETKTGAVTPE
jgi:hypothetical protein